MGYKLLWPIMRWPDDRHIELDAVGDDHEAIFVDRFNDVTDQQWAECDAVVAAPDIPAEFRAKLKNCKIFITPKVGFDNIDLVSEDEDELASNGFVKFKIHQEPDNLLGTKILNDAAIFFDFNEPIITNETDHLIGEDFIEILVSNTNVLDPALDLEVYPNPFRAETNVMLENIKLDNAKFEIYNILGNAVTSIPLENQHTSVNLEQLPLGTYFFKIFNSNELIATGKLIAQ